VTPSTNKSDPGGSTSRPGPSPEGERVLSLAGGLDARVGPPDPSQSFGPVPPDWAACGPAALQSCPFISKQALAYGLRPS